MPGSGAPFGQCAALTVCGGMQHRSVCGKGFIRRHRHVFRHRDFPSTPARLGDSRRRVPRCDTFNSCPSSLQGSEIHVLAWAVAGIFVALSLPLSLHDIHMHCVHYVSPMQKYYVRIIGMVPIYSLQSWFALRFKDNRLYFETFREAYEVRRGGGGAAAWQ